HATLQASLRGLETEGQTKAAHFETLTKQAAVVNDVPCVGHEMHASCPLLSQALAAKSQAEVQRVSVAELRESYRQKKLQAAALEPMVAQLVEKRAELKRLNEVVAIARRDLQKATELAANKPLLEATASGALAAQA